MVKLKFKSLGIRIWCMLLVMSITLIFCISIIYSVIVRGIEADYTKNMLEQSHEVFVTGIDQGEEMDSEIIKSLVRSQHILVQVDELGQIGIKPFGKKSIATPDEVKVITDEVLSILESGDINKDVKMIQHTSRNNPEVEHNIYMIISNIEKEPIQKDGMETFVVSYIKNDVKPMWQKEFTLIGLGFVLGSFIISKIIASYIISPLKKLESHAFKIASKEWVKPLEVETEDEIGSLIDSINYMQTELRKKEEDEKQFLQTISHDLKTPIMVIEGHAQAIIDGMYVESLNHTAEIILKEAERLESKVRQMLYFNTLDYTLDKAIKEQDVYMDELLMDIINKFKILSKHLEWQVDIEKVSVCGNKEQLEIAIENILDNQLRYAKSIIRVTLRQDDTAVMLFIENDGECIKADAIDRIFDYSYKEKDGKYGLGLAITKKIICYYKGSIGVKNIEDGVMFTISFGYIINKG